MAVLRTGERKEEFLCLSGDVKPTTGVSTGTTLTEIDTGAMFVWYNGTWEPDLRLIYAIQQATI